MIFMLISYCGFRIRVAPWQLLILLGVIALAVPGAGLPSISPRVAETVVDTNTPETVKVCREAIWYDPIVFILLNHVVHLFSIKGWPDETVYDITANLFLAFFMPYTGIWRCYVYFNALPVFLGRDDLQKAKWAGALCMVARGRDWEPGPGTEVAVRLDLVEDVLRGDTQTLELGEVQTEGLLDKDGPRSDNFGLRHAKLSVERVYSYYRIPTTVPLSHPYIHGQHKLPKGYVWLEVPPNATVFPLISGVKTVLASNPKLLMGVAAIGQLLFACLALYWGEGEAQKKAGYTAYSLTVIPYAIMSFLNFIVTVLVPDYSTRYLVRNNIMDEAESRGGQFSAIVGTLQRETEGDRYPEVMVFQKPESYHGKRITTAMQDINSNAHKLSLDGEGSEFQGQMKWIVEVGRKIECAYAPNIVLSTGGLLGIINMPPTAVEELIQGDPSENAPRHDIISVPSVDIHLIPAKQLYRSIWVTRFFRRSLLRIPFMFFEVLPYILIVILTGFRGGESSRLAKFWMLYWLITGQICGGLIEPFKQAALRRHIFDLSGRLSIVLLPGIVSLLVALALVLTPSIAIFIMVWRQILKYGICKVV